MAGNTNYTLYYNVLNYLKTIMKNHPSINYVTQGDVFSIDTKEFPQYPIANVIITDATFDGKSTDYGVQIVVADKTKLKSNESSGSNNTQTIEFEGVDDTVDIHANTLSILNDLISYTDRKEEGFEVNGTVSCTAFKERFDNGLAGWSADFTLRVHNDRNFCLFDLSQYPSVYKIQNVTNNNLYFVSFSESVPNGKNSFYSNELEGEFFGYKIIEEFQSDSIDLDFKNLTPRPITNPQAPVWVSNPESEFNISWLTDFELWDAFKYQSATGSDWTITYIKEDGSIVTYTPGTYTDSCNIGVLDSSGTPELGFGISC